MGRAWRWAISSTWSRCEEVSRARRPRSGSVLRRALQPVRQPDPPLGIAPSRRRGTWPRWCSAASTSAALAMSRGWGAGSDVVAMKLRADRGGRRVPAERHEVLDHQRRLMRTRWWSTARPRRVPDRAGITAFLVEKSYGRVRDRAEDRQDGHARFAHRGAGVRRLLRAGRRTCWGRSTAASAC